VCASATQLGINIASSPRRKGFASDYQQKQQTQSISLLFSTKILILMPKLSQALHWYSYLESYFSFICVFRQALHWCGAPILKVIFPSFVFLDGFNREHLSVCDRKSSPHFSFPLWVEEESVHV